MMLNVKVLLVSVSMGFVACALGERAEIEPLASKQHHQTLHGCMHHISNTPMTQKSIDEQTAIHAQVTANSQGVVRAAEIRMAAEQPNARWTKALNAMYRDFAEENGIKLSDNSARFECYETLCTMRFDVGDSRQIRHIHRFMREQTSKRTWTRSGTFPEDACGTKGLVIFWRT